MKSVLQTGGRWIRATHTEWIEPYPDWSRPYHLEMPLLIEDMSCLLDYAYSHELAICIPVSLADFWKHNSEERFEGFCKAALYLARQIVRRWDAHECGVPVFIGVSANGLETFQGYARHCNFPLSQVINLPSYANRKYGWHVKFDLLSSPGLRKYRRLLHLDASSWVNPLEDALVCSQVLSRWDADNHMVAYLNGEIRLSASAMAYPTALCGVLEQSPFAEVSRVLGTSESYERSYWNADMVEYWAGACYGTSSWFWEDAQVQEWLPRLREFLKTDEAIMTRVCVSVCAVT